MNPSVHNGSVWSVLRMDFKVHWLKFNLWRLCNCNFLRFERDTQLTDRLGSFASHLMLMDTIALGFPKNQIAHAHSLDLHRLFVLLSYPLAAAAYYMQLNIYVTDRRRKKNATQNHIVNIHPGLSWTRWFTDTISIGAWEKSII